MNFNFYDYGIKKLMRKKFIKLINIINSYFIYN